MSKPDIYILTTGGTIANPPEYEAKGHDEFLSGHYLVDQIPELSDIADITVEDIASFTSTMLTAEILFELSTRIDEILTEKDGDGVVVTSGSNGSEELSYFLQLTLNTNKPVVTTAAQRAHSTVGYDGDRNLVDAVRVVTDPAAEGRGVLSVYNDEIHSARDVSKEVSNRIDAWTSGHKGTVGFTDKRGRVSFHRDIEQSHTAGTVFDLDEYDRSDLRNIQIVYSSLDDDGRLVDASVETGADGIVLAGFPNGFAAMAPNHRSQDDALAEAAEEVPVVISHRGSEGWVYAYLDGRYDYPIITADDLTPQKARILLYLALQETNDREIIQDYFHSY